MFVGADGILKGSLLWKKVFYVLFDGKEYTELKKRIRFES
jgi:hypothetical protein